MYIVLVNVCALCFMLMFCPDIHPLKKEDTSCTTRRLESHVSTAISV